MNVLIDTNVLLSAALRDRLPERVILHIGMHDQWKWLVTPEILDEYVSVLRRPKFALSTEVLQRWTELLLNSTTCVSSPPAVAFPRDPKDAPLLAAAIATNSDYLITGDKDLFAAQGLVQTRIISVADFAQLMGVA